MKNKPTILVVDDEKGFLQILQIILKRAGYQPILANSVAEGLAQLEQVKPDMMILDDDMPEMTGGELCYKLKQNPRTSHIPILMYSAGERIHNKTYIRQIGANAILKKPCMPLDILNAVEECLNTPASV